MYTYVFTIYMYLLTKELTYIDKVNNLDLLMYFSYWLLPVSREEEISLQRSHSNVLNTKESVSILTYLLLLLPHGTCHRDTN
jgi:hypothetical protein